MSLQTVVNLHCVSDAKFYYASIKNADSLNTTASSPIVDTYTSNDAGWLWNFSSGQFQQTCTNASQILKGFSLGCTGRYFVLPVELHIPNRHYGIELWESTFPAWQASTSYTIGNTVVTYDTSGNPLYLEVSTLGTTSTVRPTGPGIDGTVTWIASTADPNSMSNYVCSVSSTDHWTGDMDFRIDASGDGQRVVQGEKFSGSACVVVDGQVINTTDLFSEDLTVTAYPAAASSSLSSEGFVDYTIDTASVTPGTTVNVSFLVNVKASTSTNAPICRVLRKRISFTVVAAVTQDLCSSTSNSCW